MKLKSHHIALKVCDLKRGEAFYAGLLGLPVLTRHRDKAGDIRSIWFDLEGVILMLERVRGAGGEEEPAGRENRGEAPGWHLLALQITKDSRRDWVEKLRRQGVAIIRESEFSIYFRDPENNNLALSHYPEPAGRY